MPAILTQTERNDELSVLLKSGWEMVASSKECPASPAPRPRFVTLACPEYI